MDILTALKTDLGITASAFDTRLEQYIEAAKREISREGVTLNLSDAGDEQLVVIYAAWMWRRRDSGDGMPRMVRYALNNRVFSEKMAEE